MDAQVTELVSRLETRTRQLLLLHKQRQEECIQLERRLQEAAEKIQNLESENKKLQENYAHLKMAKYLDMADDDMKQMRGRISKMVRDIDRCIAMLKTTE